MTWPDAMAAVFNFGGWAGFLTALGVFLVRTRKDRRSGEERAADRAEDREGTVRIQLDAALREIAEMKASQAVMEGRIEGLECRLRETEEERDRFREQLTSIYREVGQGVIDARMHARPALFPDDTGRHVLPTLSETPSGEGEKK